MCVRVCVCVCVSVWSVLCAHLVVQELGHACVEHVACMELLQQLLRPLQLPQPQRFCAFLEGTRQAGTLPHTSSTSRQRGTWRAWADNAPLVHALDPVSLLLQLVADACRICRVQVVLDLALVPRSGGVDVQALEAAAHQRLGADPPREPLLLHLRHVRSPHLSPHHQRMTSAPAAMRAAGLTATQCGHDSPSARVAPPA